MSERTALDLAALGAVSPYFALAVGPVGGPGDSPDGWRPLGELVGSPGAMRSRLDWASGRMGTDDRPVVASIAFQGWAARFTSVYAGAVALTGRAPDLSAGALSYRYPPEGGAIGLRAAAVDLLAPEEAWRRLVDGTLEPLVSAVRADVRVGRRLLWGNVASALAGSLRMLDAAGHGPLARLAAAPWADPPELAGLGGWRPDPGAPGGLSYRRTTCCLYERLPGAGRCGDCSLDP
jgi:hypothetical protein